MEKIKVMIVSSNIYKGTKVAQRLQTLLGSRFHVFGCYRDSQAENYAPNCSLIIGDNTCKTTDSDGVSYQIFYSSFDLALRNKVHYIPMSWTNIWIAWPIMIIIRTLTLLESK